MFFIPKVACQERHCFSPTPVKKLIIQYPNYDTVKPYSAVTLEQYVLAITDCYQRYYFLYFRAAKTLAST
jgi:hypothetical protein